MKLQSTKNVLRLTMFWFDRIVYVVAKSDKNFILKRYVVVIQRKWCDVTETWCPRTFDGFACWDTAPAGSTAVQACPAFIVGFDPRRLAFKR